MPLLDLIILAIIQGITEFLPISSSGHLALAHQAFNHGDENAALLLDVAVHVGTLIAVLVYVWRDLWAVLKGLIRREKWAFLKTGYICLASIPVIIAGFIYYCCAPDWFRSVPVIATTTIIFAGCLWWADGSPVKHDTLEAMTWKSALFIGLSQIFALIPGTSRSGVTMTAARFLGFSRTDSAKFSLYLGIIAISGAGVLSSVKNVDLIGSEFSYDLLIAAAFAFATALISIIVMMRWLQKSSFMPFILYRLGLGVALFVFFILS